MIHILSTAKVYQQQKLITNTVFNMMTDEKETKNQQKYAFYLLEIKLSI